MATYKGIKGVKVVTKTSDPTASEAVGTVWYNSTSPATLKYAIEGAGTWAASNPLNTARNALGAQVGTQTAALCMDGRGNEATLNVTELYDGTSWTEVADSVSTLYGRGSFGTQTAAISAGGQGPPASNVTEDWDGTSWTLTGVGINEARRDSCGCGIQTAGLITTGKTATAVTATTETWNGSTWTEVGDVNTARQEVAAANGSPVTAALIFGGNTPSPATNATESWNGTTWTEVNNLVVARTYMAGSGIQTAAFGIGGHTTTPGVPGYTATTEQFDGTSWTEVADLASARSSGGGCGSSTASVTFGGYLVGVINLTEEFNSPVYTVKTVTVS